MARGLADGGLVVQGLTLPERQWAIIVLAALAFCGLGMVGVGRGDPLGMHGGIVMVFSVAMLFMVISGYFTPEPGAERFDSYYDDPSKAGIILAMVWAVVGLFVGDWVAWLLVYPELTFDEAWAS